MRGGPRIYSIDGVTPVIAAGAFVHPEAVVIGDVIVEEGCYIGPCACLRGDFGRIHVGPGSNVQDNCTLHSLPGFDSIIGENGHIGHGAIIHSARLEPGVLVGMNSVVMDHAVIGEGAMIAAMSFVKAREKVPPRWLYAGAPARAIRALSDQELAMKREGTRAYQDLARRSAATLTPAEALREFDPTRRRVDESVRLKIREELERGKAGS